MAGHPAEHLRNALAPRLRRLLSPLGPLSPFATLDTFRPGARRLLETTERDAERVLHVVRLVLIIITTAILLFGFGLAQVLPLPFLIVGFSAVTALWIAIWRHLSHAIPSFRFRLALCVFDAGIVARGFVAAQAPLTPEPLVTTSDIGTIAPPMLVFLAMSGAFRLDPRLAAFTTVLALGLYGYFLTWTSPPPTPALANGLLIGLAGILGANGARALRSIGLKASEEQVLERYVPEGLTQELARAGVLERGGRVEDLTVLIADIRGFTSISEQLSPGGAVELLNDYFTAVVAPLAREGAVLDKYIGDGVLAFFEGPGHADRALRAGRGMLDAVEEFNVGRPDHVPLRIGVAIHTGSTLVGTIGAPSRREYTVIGDVVNVTARLEEWNKGLKAKLTISEAALTEVSDPELRVGLEGPVPLDLHGRGATVDACYLPMDSALAATRT